MRGDGGPSPSPPLFTIDPRNFGRCPAFQICSAKFARRARRPIGCGGFARQPMIASDVYRYGYGVARGLVTRTTCGAAHRSCGAARWRSQPLSKFRSVDQQMRRSCQRQLSPAADVRARLAWAALCQLRTYRRIRSGERRATTDCLWVWKRGLAPAFQLYRPVRFVFGVRSWRSCRVR